MEHITFNSAYKDYLDDFELKKRKWFLVLIPFFHLILLIIFLKFKNPFIIIGIIFSLLILKWIAFSVQNTIIILMCYISFLPNYAWGSRYSFFHKLYFQEPVLLFFMSLIFLWSIFSNYSRSGIRNTQINSKLNWIPLLFIVWIVISVLLGSFLNSDLELVRVDFLYLFLYVFYFIFTIYFSSNQLSHLVNVVALIAVAVSIEFTLLAFSEINPVSILVTRVVTQQPHLAQIGFPILASNILFYTNKWKKLFSVIGLLPVTCMIFFSQQRGLWVGIIFSLIVLGGFKFIKNKITLVQVFKYLMIILLIFASLVVILLLLDRFLFGSVLITVFSRMNTLTALSTDESLNIRLFEIIRALHQWDNNIFNILFGTGLGSHYGAVRIDRLNTVSLDNSFAYILWKMGIIGFILFMFIYIQFFIKGLFIYIHSKVLFHKQLIAAILSAIAGLCVIGLTNACLVRYRFIIFWALLLAIVELLYRQTKRGLTQNVES